MSDKRNKNKKSKEEIARQFDLPERKSKIATIMKQDGQAYCICRSSDCSRFMIGCDGCEEWYHGDCINVTEKEAKHIKQYYCQRCMEENPDLRTIFRITSNDKHFNHQNQGQSSSLDTEAAAKASGSGGAATSSSAAPSNNNASARGKSCGNCEGCRSLNCGECGPCLEGRSSNKRCVKRRCTKMNSSTNVTSKAKRRNNANKDRQRKRRRSLTPEIFLNPELEGIRQCYGPGCRRNARPQSKYCSDDCGIRLASNRIFQVLPQRIQEWNLTPCRAQEENTKQLDQIRAKQILLRRALDDLDKRHLELDELVARVKQTEVYPTQQDNSDAEDEQSMYCITCGHEIHSRTAIKHMEKCFNKYEAQATFGSIFKTRIEGNSMFCDFYNSSNKTYCKRLRVLCPEHSKDPKIEENEVCGCPLMNNVFYYTGDFCRVSKKTCFKHYMWEKIRRAEIDLERVRKWLKMDELFEQERQIRHQMLSRAGVLGLMLHSTYNHDVMEDLYRKQQQQFAAAQKKQIREIQQQQQQQQQLQQQQQQLQHQQQLQQQQQHQQILQIQLK